MSKHYTQINNYMEVALEPLNITNDTSIDTCNVLGMISLFTFI